jgi:hypothetical protein
MKKLLLIIILLCGLYGFKPDPNKCVGMITVTIIYPWTDTTYLYVVLEKTREEKKIYYIPHGGYVPQVSDRIVFDCKNIIE